jgi:hypothetical protein
MNNTPFGWKRQFLPTGRINAGMKTMMIKIAHKRVLSVLKDSAVHRTSNIMNETGCSSGDLLELHYGGFVSHSGSSGEKICITRQGLNQLTSSPPSIKE